MPAMWGLYGTQTFGVPAAVKQGNSETWPCKPWAPRNGQLYLEDGASKSAHNRSCGYHGRLQGRGLSSWEDGFSASPGEGEVEQVWGNQERVQTGCG